MKPIQVAFTPTGNRRLNELVGVSLLAVSGLLLLSLVSYRPSDPSLDTAAIGPAHNWAGIFGSTVSDLLFQFEGFAAFCLPMMLGLFGMSWLRSRAVGSPGQKLAGIALFLAVTPAVFGLLPGHMQWLGAIPVEGVFGRLLDDGLVSVLNYPGTCVLVAALVVMAILLSTAFSFTNLRRWLAVRFAFLYAWRDRWKNWQLRRSKRAAARAADRAIRARQRREGAGAATARAAASPDAIARPTRPAGSLLARVFRRPAEAGDEAMPGARRAAFAETSAPLSPEEAAYLEEPAPAPSLWTQIPRATVREPEPEVLPEGAARGTSTESDWLDGAEVADGGQDRDEDGPGPDDAGSISIGERADADAHPVTLTPRAVSGYRLPPSTLLHRSEEEQMVREDELREEARVLIEKCAEFDVRGQVTQINPGPVVTTFEFRPEAGV
jgi:S-DNA-T family DNA segregation ATPase FtsK/SpoIIIE